MSKPIKFILSLFFVFTAGFIGSLFTSSSVGNWYLELNKPAFNPPSWIFSPVWSTLYLLMAVSLYLIWSKCKKKKGWSELLIRIYRRFVGDDKQRIINLALLFFSIQLILNVFWSMFFFGLKNPILAFFDIILLLIFIIITIIYFYKIDRVASVLLWPYLGWTLFASGLNLAIILLN